MVAQSIILALRHARMDQAISQMTILTTTQARTNALNPIWEMP